MKLAISHNFLNKKNNAEPRANRQTGELTNRWAMGAFTTVDWTPAQIVEHLKAGRAICVAALTDNWRGESHFISSQMMGIDFDKSPGVEKLIEDEFIRQYAFFVYPTPSHTDASPRSRALFVLDEPIADTKRYRRLIARLLARYGQLDADPSCKDPVRIFYGSTIVGTRAASLSKVLPLAVLDSLPKTEDEVRREQAAERPKTEFKPANDHEERRAQNYAEAARKHILDDALANNVEGNRHNAFLTAVWKLVAKEKGNWPGFNAERDAQFLGKAMDRDEPEITAALRGARSKVEADDFELPPARFQRTDDYVTPPAGQEPSKPEPVLHWKTSDDSMDRYRDRLVTPQTDYLPLRFPFRALHPLGGMARIVPAGVLVGIIGASGGMKTSMAETLADSWRREEGIDVIWWGTEWDYEQMGDRAVQRYGGPSMTDVMLHQVWLAEENQAAQGAKLRERRGVRLSQRQIEEGQRVSGMIQNQWAGKAHYIEEPVSDVELLLTAMDQRVDELRAGGRDVRVAVWDYLQLLDLYRTDGREEKNENTKVEVLLGKIKLFCKVKRLIGIVGSQVTKGAASSMKEGDSLLAAEAAQFTRSDKFNLVLTLNPIYQNNMLTNRGIINVAKNSLGQTRPVEVEINPSRFVWVDTKDRTQGAAG